MITSSNTQNNGHDPFLKAQPDWGATGGTIEGSEAENLLTLQAAELSAKPLAAERANQQKTGEELAAKRGLRELAREKLAGIERTTLAASESWALPPTNGKRALLLLLLVMLVALGAASFLTNRQIALELLQNSVLATTLTIGLTVLPVGVEAAVRMMRLRDFWVYLGMLPLSFIGAGLLLREFGLASGAESDVFAAAVTEPSRVRLLIAALMSEVSLATIFMHLASGLCVIPVGSPVLNPTAKELETRISELDAEISGLQQLHGEACGRVAQIEAAAKSWIANNNAKWKQLQRRAPLTVLALVMLYVTGCSANEDSDPVRPPENYVVSLDPKSDVDAARTAINNLFSTNLALPMTLTVLDTDGRAVAQATLPRLIIDTKAARVRSVAKGAMRDIERFVEVSKSGSAAASGIDVEGVATAIKNLTLGNGKPAAVFLVGPLKPLNTKRGIVAATSANSKVKTYWLETMRGEPEPKPADLASLNAAGFDVAVALTDEKLFWPIVFTQGDKSTKVPFSARPASAQRSDVASVSPTTNGAVQAAVDPKRFVSPNPIPPTGSTNRPSNHAINSSSSTDEIFAETFPPRKNAPQAKSQEVPIPTTRSPKSDAIGSHTGGDAAIVRIDVPQGAKPPKAAVVGQTEKQADEKSIGSGSDNVRARLAKFTSDSTNVLDQLPRLFIAARSSFDSKETDPVALFVNLDEKRSHIFPGTDATSSRWVFTLHDSDSRERLEAVTLAATNLPNALITVARRTDVVSENLLPMDVELLLRDSSGQVHQKSVKLEAGQAIVLPATQLIKSRE